MSNGQWFTSEAGGQGIWALSESAAGSAPTAPTPGTPAVTGSTTVTLPWTDNSGDETSFVVQIDSGSGYVNASGDTNPTAANLVTFDATGLPAATLCHWRVGATNASGTTYAVGADFTTDNPGGGGGTIPTDLVVQDATHAHTADAVTLTTDSTLVVQDATHGHTADNVVLQIDGETTLTVDDATHAHTADSPTLTTSSTLVVQDATHAHTADNVLLTVPGSGTGASAAEIWNHVLANGESVGDNIIAIRALLAALVVGINIDKVAGTPVQGRGIPGSDPWRGS